MPIVTHEDDKELASLEGDVVKGIKKLAKEDKSIFQQIEKLGDMFNENLLDKERFLRKKRDVSKQMEVLAREDRSEITGDEVDEYKEQIGEEADLIEKQRQFVNALKDLGAEGRSFVERKEEYADAIDDLADQRINLVKIALKIEKAKNSMQPAEKLQKMEDAQKDEERTYERLKREREKKLEQFNQERAEVNRLWMALKNSIQEFQW